MYMSIDSRRNRSFKRDFKTLKWRSMWYVFCCRGGLQVWPEEREQRNKSDSRKSSHPQKAISTIDYGLIDISNAVTNFQSHDRWKNFFPLKIGIHFKPNSSIFINLTDWCICNRRAKHYEWICIKEKHDRVHSPVNNFPLFLNSYPLLSSITHWMQISSNFLSTILPPLSSTFFSFSGSRQSFSGLNDLSCPEQPVASFFFHSLLHNHNP